MSELIGIGVVATLAVVGMVLWCGAMHKQSRADRCSDAASTEYWARQHDRVADIRKQEGNRREELYFRARAKEMHESAARQCPEARKTHAKEVAA